MLHTKRISILIWVADRPQGDPQAGGFARLDPAQQPGLALSQGDLIIKAVKAGEAPCEAGCLDGLDD
jgi:hypothetical protein